MCLNWHYATLQYSIAKERRCLNQWKEATWSVAKDLLAHHRAGNGQELMPSSSNEPIKHLRISLQLAHLSGDVTDLQPGSWIFMLKANTANSNKSALATSPSYSPSSEYSKWGQNPALEVRKKHYRTFYHRLKSEATVIVAEEFRIADVLYLRRLGVAERWNNLTAKRARLRRAWIAAGLGLESFNESGKNCFLKVGVDAKKGEWATLWRRFFQPASEVLSLCRLATPLKRRHWC